MTVDVFGQVIMRLVVRQAVTQARRSDRSGIKSYLYQHNLNAVHSMQVVSLALSIDANFLINFTLYDLDARRDPFPTRATASVPFHKAKSCVALSSLFWVARTQNFHLQQKKQGSE